MTIQADGTPPDPNQAFYNKARAALSELFEKAKAQNELHFAMAMMT